MKLRYSVRQQLWGVAFIVPFIVFFVLFFVIPAGMAIWLSFVEWHPRGVTQFVGLENYTSVLGMDSFHKAVRNSFLYALMVVPASIAIALFTAILIVSLRSKRLQGFFQATFYLPGVISGLAVAIIWRFVFDFETGVLNYLVTLLGLPRVAWLGNPSTALPSLALMALFAGHGGAIIIFCAALLGIPTELYEAAEVDGANFWTRHRKITLPLLTPALLYVLVISTISALQMFVPVFVLTRGGPVYSTITVGYYIYNQLLYYANAGTAAAAGIVLLLATVGLTVIQFRRFSQVVEY